MPQKKNYKPANDKSKKKDNSDNKIYEVYEYINIGYCCGC